VITPDDPRSSATSGPGPDPFATAYYAIPAPDAPTPAAPRSPWATRAELVFGGQVVGALIIAGLLLGLIWRWWASTPTRGLAYYNNTIVPDETEGFISSDGRFLVLTGIVGLLAGALVWFRRRRRGPVAVAALAIGGVAGAALTDLVGHLVGGGTTSGKLGTQFARLPLEVHAIGLLFVEAALALWVYVLATLFAGPDDLGVGEAPAPAVLEPVSSP
jgi:hypothetical protein